MKNLKRYTFAALEAQTMCIPSEHPEGAWVKFSDIAEALKPIAQHGQPTILLEDVENIVRVNLSGAVAMAMKLDDLQVGLIKAIRMQAKQQA